MQLSKKVSEELLKAVPDASIVTDQKGRIVFANTKALDLFGFDAHELVGESVEILVPEMHRDRHVRLRGAYGQSPHSRPLLSGLELRARRKDGEEFRAEVALTPIDGDDGPLVASTISVTAPETTRSSRSRMCRSSGSTPSIGLSEPPSTW